MTAPLDGHGRLVGSYRQECSRGRGLHRDDRHPVGDHIMDIAGDTETFLGNATTRLLLTGLFCPPGPILDRHDVVAAAPHGSACGDGQAGPRDDGERVRAQHWLAEKDRRGAEEQHHRHQPGPTTGSAIVRARSHGVEHHHDGHHQRGAVTGDGH